MKMFAATKRNTSATRRSPIPSPSPAAATRRAEVRQIVHEPRLQPKLTVGAPDDKFEREADRVADQVMRMPNSAVAETVTGPPGDSHPVGGERVQRLCEQCEEKIQRLEAGSANPGAAPEVSSEARRQIHHLDGRGQPLDPSIRSFMEPRFGYNFSHVRTHTDSPADELARSVHARAFTRGNNIVFSSGQFAPQTSQGQQLLAHELVHVIQQDASQSLHLQRQCRTDEPAVPLGGQPIFFKAGKMEVDGATIDFLVNSWQNNAKPKVRIDGFASTDGSASLNLKLSCRRAEAVKRELMLRGVPATSIELFGQGETNRFSTRSLKDNRRAQIFMDLPFISGFEAAPKRQEKQKFALGVVGECKVVEVPKFVLNAQGKIHIDIGGEGHHPGANNLNPKGLGSSPPFVRPDKTFPNHVCGVGESIPASHASVDLITVEATPMSSRTFFEIARVIRPGGEIRLVHDHAPSDKRMHQRTFDVVSLFRGIDSSKTKLFTTGDSASGRTGMLSVIKLR